MRNASVAAEPRPSRDILRHVLQFCRLSSKEILTLLKETVNEWSNDKAPRLGASLAFYTLLSLAPLLIVIVTVAALAFGKEAAEGQLFWQVRGLLEPEEAKVIQGVVQSAYKPGTGRTATILGLSTWA